MKKIIIVEDCISCPLIESCKEWAKIPAKAKFLASFSPSIQKPLLKTCPLDDAK